MKNILRVTEWLLINTILITFLMCPVLYAAEETLPTPEEIILKNLKAIGGIKALKKIKNKKIVTIRKYAQRNRIVKATIYMERPNKFYTVTDKGGKVGSNGKMAWSVSPSGARLFEGDRLSNLLFTTIFDGVDGPFARYKSLKTEGIEQINGKACYKVIKTPKKGSERTVYYDKKNFMIVKITEPMQGNDKFEVYNEEYKEINGILFPYKEVLFLNGQKYEEKTYEKIELNIKMPEGIFDIPEEVKAIMDKNETEPHAQQ